MAAQLASTVFVKDPDTRQTVRLDEGTSPEPRLAALVTNPVAWVDGKLPRLPKPKPDNSGPEGSSPSAEGQDDASGAASESSAGADDQSTDTESEDAKPVAKKAATRPARGRKAAAEGTGGQ